MHHIIDEAMSVHLVWHISEEQMRFISWMMASRSGPSGSLALLVIEPVVLRDA